MLPARIGPENYAGTQHFDQRLIRKHLAPLAIAVAIEKRSPFGVSDASRAVQDMMLTGWAEGLGSNWDGFHGLDEVAKLLAVPADHDVLAIVPFGYPIDAIGRGKKQRKPLNEVVSRERFGQPFA